MRHHSDVVNEHVMMGRSCEAPEYILCLCSAWIWRLQIHFCTQPLLTSHFTKLPDFCKSYTTQSRRLRRPFLPIPCSNRPYRQPNYILTHGQSEQNHFKGAFVFRYR